VSYLSKALMKAHQKVLNYRLWISKKNDLIFPGNNAKILSPNIALVQILHKMQDKCNIWNYLTLSPKQLLPLF
jgi:hypothetical protein